MSGTQKLITLLVGIVVIGVIIWGLSSLKSKKGTGGSSKYSKNKSSTPITRPPPVPLPEPTPAPQLPVEPTQPDLGTVPTNGTEAQSTFSNTTGIDLGNNILSLGDLYRTEPTKSTDIPILPI